MSDFNHELVFHFNLARLYLDDKITFANFERSFLQAWNDFNRKYEFKIPNNEKVHQLLELRDEIFVSLDNCTKKLIPNRNFGEISVTEFRDMLQRSYQDYIRVRFFFVSESNEASA